MVPVKPKPKTISVCRVRSEMHVGDEMYINGTIQDVDIKLLIDTGACVTIISPTIFNRIPQSRRPKLTKDEVNMVAANGNQIKCWGKGVFKLQWDKTEANHTVWVADIKEDGILGFDFLRANKCILDFAECAMLMDELPNSPYENECHGRIGVSFISLLF